MTPLPPSIAIAGAWGYIGRRFLDVAMARGLTTYVYDPGLPPRDVDLSRLHVVACEAEFYGLDADVFHLATHPEHRRLDLLLARPDPPLILNEKPMALPECPEDCRQIVDAVDASRASVLYDFPELFDPLTARILDYFRRASVVRLTHIYLWRSKDREDPTNPRNFKRMVPIQYQESVHCLAFALQVLSTVKGGVSAALGGGLSVQARSVPYSPPNPGDYPYVVDGGCRYQLEVGDVHVEGVNDFKRGARWEKLRELRGFADGYPFEIIVSYLEGKKSLRIDGDDIPVDPKSSSYEYALSTAWRWSREFGRGLLMGGLFPNPRFTRLTYQLSSALWRSSRDGSNLSFSSADDLNAFDARFASEVPIFPRYALDDGSP